MCFSFEMIIILKTKKHEYIHVFLLSFMYLTLRYTKEMSGDGGESLRFPHRR